jgi:hypothetical protein
MNMSSALLLICGIISLSIDTTIRHALPSNDCLHSDIILVNIYIMEVILIYAIILISRRLNCCTISPNNSDNETSNTINGIFNDDDVIFETFNDDDVTFDDDDIKCFAIEETLEVSDSLRDIPLRLIDHDDDDCIQFLPQHSQSREDICQQCLNVSLKSSRVYGIAIHGTCAICIYCIFHLLQTMKSIKTVLLCTSFFVLSINDYYQKHIVSIRESNPLTPTVQLYSSVICSRLQDYTLYPTMLIIYGISLVLYGIEVINNDEWGTLNMYNVVFDYMVPVFLPFGINICIRTQSVKHMLENSLPLLSFICVLSTIISWNDIECITTFIVLEYFQHFDMLLALLALPISDILTIAIFLMVSRNKKNIHAAIVFTCIGIAIHEYNQTVPNQTVSNQTSIIVDQTTSRSIPLNSWATLCIVLVLMLSIIYDCIVF